MTAPKTARRPRARKPPAMKALAVRTPWADGLAADFLILSARLAETPPPVFWAEGELDARTTLAVAENVGYDENYRRVIEDPEWDWDWYRAAMLADDLEAVPVVTLTVVPDLPVLMPGTPLDPDADLDAKVAALMKLYDEDEPGTSWGTADVPGPEGGADPQATAPSTVLPPDGAPGPGTPQDASAPGEVRS